MARSWLGLAVALRLTLACVGEWDPPRPTPAPATPLLTPSSPPHTDTVVADPEPDTCADASGGRGSRTCASEPAANEIAPRYRQWSFEPTADERPVHNVAASKKMVRALEEAYRAAATKWGEAEKLREVGRKDAFYVLSQAAIKDSLRLVSQAEAKLRGDGREGVRSLWPAIVVNVARMVATGLQTQANTIGPYNDNQKMRETRLGHIREALEHVHVVFQHSPVGHPFRVAALEQGSQLFTDLNLFCRSTELLQQFVELHGGGLRAAIGALSPLSRQQFPIVAHACDPEFSLRVFDIVRKDDFISPARADESLKCWPIMMTTMRSLGRADDADAFFTDELRAHVRWVHPFQMPSTFNTRLATPEPQPFYEPSELRVAKKLLESRDQIIAEYLAYEALVASKQAEERYDDEHPESYLAEENGDVQWKYLIMRHGSRWDTELCKHLPTACSVVRDLPEVSNMLKPLGDGCDGYCQPTDRPLETAGLVSFYFLGPGKTIKPHLGPSNQRLKCHLAIRAPESGPLGASITVGGVQRGYASGDVFCFDDSYEHSVINGGGKHANVTRVVFDVTFWHPKLAEYFE